MNCVLDLVHSLSTPALGSAAPHSRADTLALTASSKANLSELIWFSKLNLFQADDQ